MANTLASATAPGNSSVKTTVNQDAEKPSARFSLATTRISATWVEAILISLAANISVTSNGAFAAIVAEMSLAVSSIAVIFEI